MSVLPNKHTSRTIDKNICPFRYRFRVFDFKKSKGQYELISRESRVPGLVPVHRTTTTQTKMTLSQERMKTNDKRTCAKVQVRVPV
jgi:hypothetical protein